MLGRVLGPVTKPMRRRQFITLLGGAAAAWPRASRAQEPERRRIGVLLSPAADDLEYQGRIAAFQQALQQLGWTDARNVRIDIRWGLGWDAELIRVQPDRYCRSRPRHAQSVGLQQGAGARAQSGAVR